MRAYPISWRGGVVVAATLAATGQICAQAPAPAIASNAVDPDAYRAAAALVARLTIDEKIAQLLNVAPAIPRLGIPAYNWWTESLHGALGPVPTTNFPEPIGLAASFDAPLLKTVAGAISTEVRALHTLGRATGRLGKIGTGLDTWSPNINLFRDPRWGRGQETYGEDPYLTATLGVAFIQGMQGPNPASPDVIATPKHFAVHSGPESTRHSADVIVSLHDLEDSYLPAFRAAIVDGRAGSIMCAYNRVNGQPACGSTMLLKDHLRGAWGFRGYVVSDCDAVVDISEHHKYAPDPAAGVAVALKAGVDNECNGATLSGTPNLGARYREALTRGLIVHADIDRALIRLFSARYRNGDLVRGIVARTPTPVTRIETAAHRALAQRMAAESLVLLKNDGVLPLKPGARIALIGPLADATRVLRGNYSSPQSAPPISVDAGLRQVMVAGGRVTLIPFTASITDGDPVPDTAFVTPDGRPGLHTDYFNARAAAGGDPNKATYATTAIATHIERNVRSGAAQLRTVGERHKIVWTGALVAPETGTYRIALTGVTGAITLDNNRSIAANTASRWAEPLHLSDVDLVKGARYPLRLEAESSGSGLPGVVWKRITRTPERDLAAGIADADVVIAVVGLTSDLEGEEMPVKVDGFAGGDRRSLSLPADQIALLEQAKRTGKPLIVVAMNGSAIDLRWAKANAAAIVEAWYPGQSGGLAVAETLMGTINPAGRLPVTFYGDVAALPAFDDYAMTGRTYRYYTGTPVFPFGHGLSYTSFDYAPLRLTPAAIGAEYGLRATTTVRNTGKRAGDEVVQLYLNFPDTPGVPRIALRGYRRITLAPGESKAVTFALSPRDLSSVTPDGVRQVVAGQYRVSVGAGQPGTGVPTRSANFTTASTIALPR
ncbi:glycoside hydrolase family 3 [Sphingomonas sp. Leaf34]|uniref:glycoside hydrolase family 3 C-terminal domain-containing protein n=1 Tax=Sphingomonas sp. Leaf34 TaxID=1736216 RepID=UPI0006F598AD|nr:glycoside hydrolase family 3 C-terminal domain-containing protein [Sphingomonas sp. Leaf34]KQN28349.1 glycoside hydrolase family 3 [Sphingomonas sp. Leaf34]